MPNKILLFIRSEEVATGATFIGCPISDGVQTHYCTMRETVKTERITSEADKMLMEIVNEIAKEKGLIVEVYDVVSLKGKMKARSNDVKRTPAIVIGKQKSEGALTKEQITEKVNAEINK